MSYKDQLKVLKLIWRTPRFPAIFSMPTFSEADPFGLVDTQVMAYAKASGYHLELDKRGLMSYNNYNKMMDHLNLNKNCVIPIFTKIGT